MNEIFSRSQYAITDSLMNSPPLSVSIPRIGKGKSVRARPDGCQDRLLAPMQEGKALGPACGYIGERQRVQVTALSVFATVGYHVRF